MFSRRNFAQKDDSTYLKLLKGLTFAKKAKCVLKMSKFWQNLTFQCPFSVSKFGSNHDFRPVLEMP